jgi:hypothetical protein
VLMWHLLLLCQRPHAFAGKDRYYLALTFYNQGNYESNVAFFFVNMVTFWLLFSYLVPISLFVTIEVVKFILVSLLLPLCSCFCLLLCWLLLAERTL